MAEKPEGYGETPESHATAQQVLTDFYDEFLKKMDANAVSMLLQAKEIISDGDSKTIQGHASLKQQNLILHRVLMKKCTDEAFKLACDVIIKADPSNAVMIKLAENMKRRLEPHTELQRKWPRSSSQSSEELVLQPHKRHHDYLDLKMDLLAQDISDLRCESDPNAIIRLLYSNALGVITKLLQPHLADVKKLASRYCQLDLHHGKVTERMITSAKSIEGLLNQMSVTKKWDDTRFLRKAVAAIPLAPKRNVAEVILSYYDLHLIHYKRATLLKKKPRRKGRKPTEKNMKLVPFEITIQKPFSDVTMEDCHRLHVHVLSTAYGIPEESIIYYGAEERHSTTITYLIPRQYISEIMQRNTQLETVWVLLELDVIEVAIPDVFLFKPSVDLCLNLLKNSRTFKVDLLGMTEVLPYQMYALVDTNVEPLMWFDRPNSGTTAGCVSHPSMDSTDLEIVFKGSGPSIFLDFESPGTPSPVATISPSVKEEPLSTTYQSKAAPAVPERGAHESRASERHRDTPGSSNFAQQVLTDFYDDFLEKMEANVVIMGLQERNIVADGDVKTIFRHTDQKLQNEILHGVLKKKCTDEAFKVACDVIIKADPSNAVMVDLAKNMKRSLQSYTDHPNTQQMSEDEANISADIPRRRRSSPHVNQPSENTFLNLSHFWPYRWLHYVQNDMPALSAFIKVCLLLTVIAQLPFILPILDLSVHHSANQCSCISLDKRFFMYTTVFLYFFTRSLLPLITVWAFSSAVISKLGTQSSAFASDFLKQSSRRRNETVFRAVVRIFWDVRLAETANSLGKTLTRQLEEKLTAMCITSILEAIIITLILVQVGSTRFALDVYSISFGGVLDGLIVCVDALSYFTLIVTIGIICSFFNHEAIMNRLIAGTVALEDHASDSFGVQPSKELMKSAKNAMNSFNNRWSTAEIVLFISMQLYTLILVSFAAAGLPLSCGVTAHMHAEQVNPYWFTFVIAFSVAHFLSTCVWPSAFDASEVRYAGIILEVFILIALYIVQPPLFGTFLQILFAIIPAAYLFWYLWIKVRYENSVRSAKPKEWRRQHQRNMGIYICLMVQLVVAIVVSIYSESSILSSSSSSCERSIRNTLQAAHYDQCTF